MVTRKKEKKRGRPKTGEPVETTYRLCRDCLTTPGSRVPPAETRSLRSGDE
jgi:hypothetical protein